MHRKLLVFLPAFFVSLTLGACSASYAKCLSMRASGEMFSSLDACQRCVDQNGSGNLDVVRGCAIGVDAAALLTETSPLTDSGRRTRLGNPEPQGYQPLL